MWNFEKFKFKKGLKILKSQKSFDKPQSHANEIYAHNLQFIMEESDPLGNEHILKLFEIII